MAITMTPIQGKIAEIMGTLNLEELAQQTVDSLSSQVADHADLIAIARCEEKGVEEHDSHDAHKIYEAAEAMILNAIIHHMTNVVNMGRQS